MTKYYTFFIGRIYFASNDGSQNKFAYQQILVVLELKKDKGADYICKWKGVFNFKLKPLYTVFWHARKNIERKNPYSSNHLQKNTLYFGKNIVKNLLNI